MTRRLTNPSQRAIRLLPTDSIDDRTGSDSIAVCHERVSRNYRNAAWFTGEIHLRQEHRSISCEEGSCAGLQLSIPFGFLPHTEAEDGDPLDIVVLTHQHLPIGVLLEVKVVGAIQLEETEDGGTFRNDRVLAVPELEGSVGSIP